MSGPMRGEEGGAAAGPAMAPARLALGAGRIPGTSAELLRVRLHLAEALLERLCDVRPDPAPVAAAVDAFAAGVARGAATGELARLDLAIVAALVSASGSDVLSLLMSPVQAVLERAPALQGAMYADPLHNLASYHALLVWLDDPTPHGIAPLVGLLGARDAETLGRLPGGGDRG
ncbi:MAG: hypothetical protein H6742_08585 [Alphaproteobacteria bacterium]|nr:hypothetical protein [Alphaproteobacteria bacterium]